MRAHLALLLAVTLAPAPVRATFEVEGFRQGMERTQAESLAVHKGFSVSQIDDSNIHICKSKDYCYTLAFCMDHLHFLAYNVDGGTAAFARIAEQNLAKFGQPNAWASTDVGQSGPVAQIKLSFYAASHVESVSLINFRGFDAVSISFTTPTECPRHR
jgi:hypothetical protein